MPFAVFEGDDRLTRVFATEQDAWDAAGSAGLVEIAPDGSQVLEDHLEIRPCPADAQDAAAVASDLST